MFCYEKGKKEIGLMLKVGDKVDFCTTQYKIKNKEEFFYELFEMLMMLFVGPDPDTEDIDIKEWLEKKLHKENWDIE